MKTQIRVIHYLSMSKNPKPRIGEAPSRWRSNVWMSSRMVDGVESKDSVCLACIPVSMVSDLAPLTNGPDDRFSVVVRSVRERSEAPAPAVSTHGRK